jgi:hypothetical protein
LTHDIAPFSFPDSVNQLMLSQYLWKRPELTMSFPVRGVKLPAEGHADDTVRSAVLAGSDLASVLRIVLRSPHPCVSLLHVSGRPSTARVADSVESMGRNPSAEIS